MLGIALLHKEKYTEGVKELEKVRNYIFFSSDLCVYFDEADKLLDP